MKAGKRSYNIVATIQDSQSETSPSLFQTLSSNFELCVAGLGFVRLDLDRFREAHYRQGKDILLH